MKDRHRHWQSAVFIILVLAIVMVLRFEKEQSYTVKFHNETGSQIDNVGVYFQERRIGFGYISSYASKTRFDVSISPPKIGIAKWANQNGIHFERDINLIDLPKDYNGYVLHFTIIGEDLVEFEFYAK